MEIIKRLQQLASSEGACLKKKVGCIIQLDGKVLVEAANGRPGKKSCLDGFCYRCASAEKFARGRDHDLCSCLHAEQNAITKAGRAGIALEGSMLFSTYQPCLTCLKLIVGVGVSGIRYIEPWTVPTVDILPDLAEDYASLEAEFPSGVIQL